MKKIKKNSKKKWHRKYNTSKEFSKDIKFNRKWYHLVALFDQDRDLEFNFNDSNIDTDVSKEKFDFNDDSLDVIYYNFDQTDQLDYTDFDFNEVLLEKKSI